MTGPSTDVYVFVRVGSSRLGDGLVCEFSVLFVNNIR